MTGFGKHQEKIQKNTSFRLNSTARGGSLLFENSKRFLGCLLLAFYLYMTSAKECAWPVPLWAGGILLTAVFTVYYCLAAGGVFLHLAGFVLFLILPLGFSVFENVRQQWSDIFHDLFQKSASGGLGIGIFSSFPEDDVWRILCLLSFFMLLAVLTVEAGKKTVCLMGITGIWCLFLLLFSDGTGVGSLFLFLVPGFLLLVMPSLPGAVFCILPCVLLGILVGTGVEKGRFADALEKWRFAIESTVLPEGKLSDFASLQREDKAALEVTMDKNSPYYLRGYIGMVFQDDCWGNESDALRFLETGFSGEGSGDFFESLRRNGFACQTLLSGYASKCIGKTEMPLNHLQIKNVGANRRYYYLPYECVTPAEQYVQDGQALWGYGENLYGRGLKGIRDYSCAAYLCLAGEERLKEGKTPSGEENSNTGSQDNMGQFYENVVKQIGLSLPRNVREEVAAVADNPVSTTVSAQSVIRKVKKWFEKNITYDESPGAIPEGEDFATWFFQEEKRGCDVHYAAAAVMLFRYYGVPARYVEGYLITPELLDGQEDGATITVTEQEAHAWPEIYIDERGWIPVEVLEEYENKMGISYPDFQEGAAKAPTSGETESSEPENAQETTTQEVTEEQTEETTTQTEGKVEKKEPSADRGNAFGKGKRVMRGVIIFVLVLFILLFFRIEKNRRWESKWKNSPDHGYFVRMHYRKVECLLRMLEEKSGQRDEDNRMRKRKEALKRYGTSLDEKKMEEGLAIRQKAVYAPEAIDRKERETAGTFFEQAEKMLWRQLTIVEKLKFLLRRR